MKKIIHYVVLLSLSITSMELFALSEFIEKTELSSVKVTTLAEGLDHPWGLAFLPDGKMLVTERSGSLKLITKNGESITTVTGLPAIVAKGQGGLLDIAVHPQFSDNNLVYFSYTAGDFFSVGTEVARAKLNGHQLENVETIFQLNIKTYSKRHFGSRLVFDNKNNLYITLGDRGDKARAQKLDDHAGSVIRLTDDGLIPADNPFIKMNNAKAEIFSYGHRNIQGATLHPNTGELWIHEHGPQGGDELNISRSGQNFGWPIITYGVNYVIGTKIGEGFEKPGMMQPLYHWVPSIAPSGMTFYEGSSIAPWKGNLFVGSLKFQTLVRLEVSGEKVVHEERLFNNRLGRIRDVREGPDGLLYLLTDSDNGLLVRVSEQGQ